MTSPAMWNVRPFTAAAASVHSHTTSGEILRGASASGSQFACGWTVPLRGPIVVSISVRHLAVRSA